MSAPSRAPEPLDQPSGLLPVDPPARGARWTGWLLLALAAAVAVFSVTFRLPETVVAPFLLVPAEGEDPVQAPIAGEIAAVRVQEGETVSAGQELFLLRSDDIRNAHARIRQLNEDTQALTERARRLDEAHVAELAGKDAEIAQGERELGFRGQHLASIRDLKRRAEQLAKAGGVSTVELLAHQLDEAESENNRAVAEKQLRQLALGRQEQVAARLRQRAEEQAEAEKARDQIRTLQEQLRDSTGDLRTVRAPYDAVVLRLVQRTVGGVVEVGAPLCHLARVDSRPRAQLALPELAVPRLAAGQHVRLFADAYPYQRYGTVAAEIAWLSPAPVDIGGGRSFIALADLRPASDAPLPLRVGMGGKARVIVGRRTLLEHALEPLRGLRERLRTE